MIIMYLDVTQVAAKVKHFSHLTILIELFYNYLLSFGLNYIFSEGIGCIMYH